MCSKNADFGAHCGDPMLLMALINQVYMLQALIDLSFSVPSSYLMIQHDKGPMNQASYVDHFAVDRSSVDKEKEYEESIIDLETLTAQMAY